MLSRALPEKLTGLQAVKKLSAFYGTQRFVTTFTSVHYLSLSLARLIQSMRPHTTLEDSFYYDPPIYVMLSDNPEYSIIRPLSGPMRVGLMKLCCTCILTRQKEKETNTL
jgi:hypothetical protein